MRVSKSLLVMAAITIAGCSNYGTSSGGTGGRSTSILVGNDYYSLVPDTVASGAQITWTWATPSHGHTVNWDSGPGTLPANSATMTSGSYNATLTTAGTYHYHCLVHGAAMSGVVVVQ